MKFKKKKGEERYLIVKITIAHGHWEISNCHLDITDYAAQERLSTDQPPQRSEIQQLFSCARVTADR